MTTIVDGGVPTAHDEFASKDAQAQNNANDIQGAMPEGSVVADLTPNKPVYAGGIDRATGEFHGFSVNATGEINVLLSGTSVFNLTQVGGTNVVTAGVNGLIAVGGNAASGAADTGYPVKAAGVFLTAPLTLTNGQRGDLTLDNRQALRIVMTSGGSNITSGSTNSIPAAGSVGYVVLGYNKPITAGGLTLARVVTGTSGFIKSTAGQPYTLNVYNSNAAVRYLHLYNKSSAPTLSTDTPIATITLLANSVTNIDWTNLGLAGFTNGIAWAYTTDNIAIPATAGTSGECQFTIGYC
jgi:hypothetical protein